MIPVLPVNYVCGFVSWRMSQLGRMLVKLGWLGLGSAVVEPWAGVGLAMPVYDDYL